MIDEGRELSENGKLEFGWVGEWFEWFFFFNECNAKRGNHFFSTLRIQYASVSLTHSGVDTVVVSRPELKNARAISRSETGNTTG